jgi:hypothetical protein
MLKSEEISSFLHHGDPHRHGNLFGTPSWIISVALMALSAIQLPSRIRFP